jgi:hypothetical protein
MPINEYDLLSVLDKTIPLKQLGRNIYKEILSTLLLFETTENSRKNLIKAIIREYNSCNVNSLEALKFDVFKILKNHQIDTSDNKKKKNMMNLLKEDDR